MSEKEFKSFRFTDSNDPSDELLRQLMQRVAHKAKEDNKVGVSNYFEKLKKEADKQRKVALNG